MDRLTRLAGSSHTVQKITSPVAVKGSAAWTCDHIVQSHRLSLSVPIPSHLTTTWMLSACVVGKSKLQDRWIAGHAPRVRLERRRHAENNMLLTTIVNVARMLVTEIAVGVCRAG